MSAESTTASEAAQFTVKLRYEKAHALLVGANFLLNKMNQEQKISDHTMLAAANLVEQAMDEKKLGDKVAREAGIQTGV